MIFKTFQKLAFFIFLIMISLVSGIFELEFKYHSNEELREILKNFTGLKNEPSAFRSRAYSIGVTSDGNDLLVVEITASEEFKAEVPNIKLIGNIHGNEPVGREVLLQYLFFLRDAFDQGDQNITWLLNHTKIHIMPSLNPDGYDRSVTRDCIGEKGRKNGKGKMDLNRSFPDFYHSKKETSLQPETKAVMRWMEEIPFILSASFHGGAMVASYPFDTEKETKWQRYLWEAQAIRDPKNLEKLTEKYFASSLGINPVSSTTPDDDVFKHLANVYSQNHKIMHLGKPCRGEEIRFEKGVTNGANWYPFTGGMGDYNYYKHGCMELTLEISCCKFPPESQLPSLWEENKQALISFSFESLKGITGQVLDHDSKTPIKSANLQIVNRNITFTSDIKYGQFWRLLLPGNYTLQVSAEQYHSITVDFTVPEPKKLPKLEIVNIYLKKITYVSTFVRGANNLSGQNLSQKKQNNMFAKPRKRIEGGKDENGTLGRNPNKNHFVDNVNFSQMTSIFSLNSFFISLSALHLIKNIFWLF